MAASSEPAVFQKEGDESDEDAWDDEALVRAYDAAVNAAKNGLRGSTEKEPRSKKRKSHRPNQEKNRSQQESTSKWKVGDRILAAYSEDNEAYPASIVSVNNRSGTCVVRFEAYDNEEEKRMEDLLPCTDAESSASESEEKYPECDTTRPSPSQRPQQQRMSFPPFSTTRMNFPFMPPPPPPPSIHDSSIDNEALCSMLISWYMTGYHTGYYQGLRDAQSHRNQKS